MDRKGLMKKTKSELNQMARRLSLKGFSRMKKAELVALIMKHGKERDRGRKAAGDGTEGTQPAAGPVEKKYREHKTERKIERVMAVAPAAAIETGFSGGAGHMEALRRTPVRPPQVAVSQEKPADLPGDDDLPGGYSRDCLFLIARDHEWLYAYWELSAERRRDLDARHEGSLLTLKLFRLERSERLEEQRIPLQWETRDWFFHVIGDGRIYCAELGSEEHGYQPLLVSRPAITPRATAGTAQSVQFVTIPVKVPLKDIIATLRPFLDDPHMLAQKLRELQHLGIHAPIEAANLGEIDRHIRKRLGGFLMGVRDFGSSHDLPSS
ncbi:DUF4912 domain-containing protein [bacterium]|nr:DUF4912 domain-containing protein [candidate division CSSED10-310 bacterium]